MKRIVFYSWQSDLPNSTNRGLIQQTLEKVVHSIAQDNSVEVEPVLDRDTQGIAGSPDIASTIFAKITSADVFVADVSIISNPGNGRVTPNPNVLIELGFALKSIGYERVVLVFNRAFGKIEDLPFDLRTRRLAIYNVSSESKDKAAERVKLEQLLEVAIRSALGSRTEVAPTTTPAVEAIESKLPNKTIILRRNLVEILDKINKGQAKPYSEGGTAEDLISAINSTQDFVAEFSKIIETISIMNDSELAMEVYRWFGSILERYYYAPGKNGKVSNADHDYFKFIGHEMFVSMVAFLIRENRWAILKKILAEPILVRHFGGENGPQNLYWDDVSHDLPLLSDDSTHKKRISVHADILDERHRTGGLSTIMPIDEFVGADFFLFLLGALPQTKYNGYSIWRPWSVLYMHQAPVFLVNAEQKQYAEHLASILKVGSVDELKKRLTERQDGVRRLFDRGFWRNPITSKDIERIGTR